MNGGALTKEPAVLLSGAKNEGRALAKDHAILPYPCKFILNYRKTYFLKYLHCWVKIVFKLQF